MKSLTVSQLRLAPVVIVGLISIVCVSSVDVVRNRVASSGNETIKTDNINGTSEFMKRAGEFASRALWMKKGKFVLPAGTIISLAPKITIPTFRRKAFKGGLNSDFQATLYFYINCDKLGYTSDMHPFPFDRPPFYPFGPLMRPIESKDYPSPGDKDKKNEKMPHNMMKPHDHMHSGSNEGFKPGPPPKYSGPMVDENGVDSYRAGQRDTVYTFFPIQRSGAAAQAKQKTKPAPARKPRSVMDLPPPDKMPGGERALLLPKMENIMSNFGFQGKGCMLRAICEIHQFPMQEGYGLLGEMIALFFSVSQSPYAESHMPEYLKAEKAGRLGQCAEYRKLCAKSVFKWEVERKKHNDDEIETNEVPMSLYRSKFEDDEL